MLLKQLKKIVPSSINFSTFAEIYSARLFLRRKGGNKDVTRRSVEEVFSPCGRRRTRRMGRGWRRQEAPSASRDLGWLDPVFPSTATVCHPWRGILHILQPQVPVNFILPEVRVGTCQRCHLYKVSVPLSSLDKTNLNRVKELLLLPLLVNENKKQAPYLISSKMRINENLW